MVSRLFCFQAKIVNFIHSKTQINNLNITLVYIAVLPPEILSSFSDSNPDMLSVPPAVVHDSDDNTFWLVVADQTDATFGQNQG